MAKRLIVDLSGKVLGYDVALFDQIERQSKKKVQLLYPGHGLISIVPHVWKNSEFIVKRLLKALEGLINYLILLFYLLFNRIEILHLQWLPFIEFINIENVIIQLFKFVTPKTMIILTVHNIYPHNMTEDKKVKYKARFIKVCKGIDCFIVHTQISKKDLSKEFGIEEDKIHICCHGVFTPKNVIIKKTYRDSGKLRILQFGGHSYYKGTDILVDSISQLPKEYADKIETHIVGGISHIFLSKLHAKDVEGRINWKPYFLSDEELNNEINDCDMVILPYRDISQSGVLLLAIYFNRLIITSNLPSFIETMRGEKKDDSLDSSFFFESENPQSLSQLLKKYINKEIDETAIHNRITHLRQLYSWENAAKSTLNVYRDCISNHN